jgi:hypothetical protein
MKLVVTFVFAAVILCGADQLRLFGYDWSVPVASDWKATEESGSPILQLMKGKEPVSTLPRRPAQFAIAQTPDFSKVMVEADVKPLGRSVMIVFAYHDSAHFNYAHLSTDPGTKVAVHNGIFHVYGGERVRISSVDGPPAFPANNRWYHVVLTHDGKSGTVHVNVDGKPVPALHGVDLSLTDGKIGIGSFDETGEFKNVKITGMPTSS